MKNKIWYSLINTKNYPTLDGLLKIDKSNHQEHLLFINESIESFNSNHNWDSMWDIETSKQRFNDNHILFLVRDDKGPLAHVWTDKNYLYNVYVNPRRPKDYGVKFIWACLNEIDYDNIYVWVDMWNTRSQRFTEKIGFKKHNTMEYNKLYESYLEYLIDSYQTPITSIMYPPDYQGDKIIQPVDNISTVVFTTGTTGDPKPVLHDFESIKNAIKNNTNILNITSNDILLNFLPTWTIGTYIYTVPTYFKGGKIYHDKFTPDGFKEYLKHKPTTTLLIPTMIDMMIDSGLTFDLSSFRNIGIGAEQVDLKHIKYMFELGAQSVTHMYGSSEAIPLVLYNTFHSIDDIDLGLKEVETFKYKNSDSLLISGVSVADSYYGEDKITWYDSKDNFKIKNNLYYWQKRTDNIVKKKGWKTVMDRKYTIIEKEFSADLDSNSLVWHIDEGDREVTILETGGDWKFEAKDRDPRILKEGDVIFVSKTTLHKIHKGNGNMKVLIKQYQ